MFSFSAWLRRQSAGTQLVLVLGVVGYFARVSLALASDGSTDFAIWHYFGRFITENSLRAAYVKLDGTMPYQSGVVPVFNHPPVMALLGALWYRLAGATGVRFSIWLKLPGLLMEWVSGVVLGLYWARKSGFAGAVAWAAYGWSLCSILVSGYHGNTDAACAGLCLVGVYLLATRGMDFWGGLALAAAINVKIYPLLLLPPLLAHYRAWPRARRFLAGVAVGLLPFLPVAVSVPRSLFHNVFRYVPQRDYWGVQALLLTCFDNPRYGAWAIAASERYLVLGTVGLTLSVLALAAAVRWRPGRWGPYELGTLTYALFLIVTPGFGVQYVVLICPLFFAVSLKWASTFAWLSGAMLLIVYTTWYAPSFPWTSFFHGGIPFPGPFFGMLAWGLLVAWTMRTLRSGPNSVDTAVMQPGSPERTLRG